MMSNSKTERRIRLSLRYCDYSQLSNNCFDAQNEESKMFLRKLSAFILLN